MISSRTASSRAARRVACTYLIGPRAHPAAPQALEVEPQLPRRQCRQPLGGRGPGSGSGRRCSGRPPACSAAPGPRRSASSHSLRYASSVRSAGAIDAARVRPVTQLGHLALDLLAGPPVERAPHPPAIRLVHVHLRRPAPVGALVDRSLPVRPSARAWRSRRLTDLEVLDVVPQRPRRDPPRSADLHRPQLALADQVVDPALARCRAAAPPPRS